MIDQWVEDQLAKQVRRERRTVRMRLDFFRRERMFGRNQQWQVILQPFLANLSTTKYGTLVTMNASLHPACSLNGCQLTTLALV